MAGRVRLYEERIADIDEEIRMVHEGTHPELVAMMEAVNKRRDDKIRLYDTQLKYNMLSLNNTTDATRAQLHSQYSQNVREARERYLDMISEQLYQIQRERRACDSVVPGMLMFIYLAFVGGGLTHRRLHVPDFGKSKSEVERAPGVYDGSRHSVGYCQVYWLSGSAGGQGCAAE